PRLAVAPRRNRPPCQRSVHASNGWAKLGKRIARGGSGLASALYLRLLRGVAGAPKQVYQVSAKAILAHDAGRHSARYADGAGRAQSNAHLTPEKFLPTFTGEPHRFCREISCEMYRAGAACPTDPFIGPTCA